MNHQQPLIESFFEPVTGTFTHVVFDRPGGHAAVIDPVLDFDARSGRLSHTALAPVLAFLDHQSLTLDWILETHAHADHLSAAQALRREMGGRVAIGAEIRTVQTVFKGLFNLEPGFATDGRQFDRLLSEGDELIVGDLTITAWHVPGHTPADMAYQVGDAVFVGDTLFMPDVGTARCDFPGGDARQLYRSIRRLLALPADTRLFMCHDYPPEGRSPCRLSTVGEQRQSNVHVRDGVSEDEFVSLRQGRDATLAMPNLILPSVQVNIRAGHLPPPEGDGRHYLKIPLNAL